jgi:hypothetical protein
LSIQGSSPQRTPEAAKAPARLSDEHRRTLEVESGISAGVLAGRGYWTVTSRSQLVGMFPKWQRRAPALFVPMFSPDGVTTRAQIRPQSPRIKDGKPVKYETAHGAGLILDVHPAMLEAVRDASTPLWITEGVKTGDSATSRGRCTLVLQGVDCWQSKGVPLACWQQVVLEGRRVFVCFDHDVLYKAPVQRALAKLVAYLESRGALVRIVYLPRPGGLDDNLAAGENIAELEMAARPFDAEALAAERRENNAPLRAALAERRSYLREMPVKTIGQNTRAAVVRILTLEAERSGELAPDGVRVEMDRRTLAERAAKSTKAVNKAIQYLEGEERTLRRDNNGRRVDKRGAFVLLTEAVAQKGTQDGGREAPEGREGQEGEGFSQVFNAPSDRGEYPSALSDEVPALRWSRVILYWARKDGRDVVAATHYIRRLGEKRGNILRHVLEAGGEAPEAEIFDRFASNKSRAWDFRRRTLGPLLGILTLRDPETGKTVQVATGPLIMGRFITSDGVPVLRVHPDWRKALERARADAGELEDAERQREKHADQRRDYREKYPRRHEHPADEEPELLGRERVEEIVAERAAEEERRAIEAEREKVGITPAVFLADELEGRVGFSWRELRGRWIERGGKPEMLRQAVASGPYRFKREEVDGQLYVYHAPATETARAPIAVPEEPARRGPFKGADGVYVHPPDCACEWCSEDLKPRYSKPRLEALGAS